jgi:hypothetical protein
MALVHVTFALIIFSSLVEASFLQTVKVQKIQIVEGGTFKWDNCGK